MQHCTSIQPSLQKKHFLNGCLLALTQCTTQYVIFTEEHELVLNILDYLAKLQREMDLRSTRPRIFTLKERSYSLPSERVWVTYTFPRKNQHPEETTPTLRYVNESLIFTVHQDHETGAFKDVTLRSTNWGELQSIYREIAQTNWTGVDAEYQPPLLPAETGAEAMATAPVSQRVELVEDDSPTTSPAPSPVPPTPPPRTVTLDPEFRSQFMSPSSSTDPRDSPIPVSLDHPDPLDTYEGEDGDPTV